MKQIPESHIRAWVASNFDYKERRDGDELVICCPFDGDSEFKFNISPSKGVCHYWRGDGWAPPSKKDKRKRDTSFLRFVCIYRKCTIAKALQEILGAEASKFLAAARLKAEDEHEAIQPSIALPDGATPILNSPSPTLARGLLKWLQSRGVSEAEVERHNLHHLGSDVIWPYYEFGELVYWQSRSRLNKRFQFPSKESAGVGKEDFLFGFDMVEPYSHLIITEAIFDAHAVGAQAVASGGASLTDRQIAKIGLLRPTEGVVIAPDNDLAGLESLVKNSKMLLDSGWKVFQCVAPRLPYKRSGEVVYTKDWNEVGQFVIGWDGIKQLFDETVKPLGQIELIRLRGLVLDKQYAKNLG